MIQRTALIVQSLLIRQQPAQSMVNVIKAGAGGLLAIGLVAWLFHRLPPQAVYPLAGK